MRSRTRGGRPTSHRWRRFGRGDHPWRTLDALHRASLDDLIEQFDLGDVDRDALVGAWHRLDPWPDAIPGLGRLRTKVVIAPLSNGHVRLLTNMAKRAGLPWDLVLSAQLAGTYKPDAAVYRTAVDLLDCPAEDVMMVAAHPRDLDAAADVGLRTAYVHRPNEWGPEGPSERPPTDAYDLAVDGIGALADELGVPSRLD